MKKLKLGAKDVKDILSREEMRKIGGGAGSGGGGSCDCNTGSDCSTKGHGCMADCTPSGGYNRHCAPSS